ncbi:MAG: MBL fold metallo-hydrolase [Oligoflexales bacterium]
MAEVEITVLGSGTSVGVPVIGCDCDICYEPKPKNIRTRCCLQVKFPDNRIAIFDTPPDFRTQILKAKTKSIDAVLYTHTHADHTHGFDDLRAFYFQNRQPVPCWITKDHAIDLTQRFQYAFQDTGYAGSPPQVTLNTITSHFNLFGYEVETFQLPHGAGTTTAFRIGQFAYATDFQHMPDHVKDAWRGKIHTMVASGIGWKPHATHSSVRETEALFEELGVEHGIIHHLSHTVDYYKHTLKTGYEFAFDNMNFKASV